MGATGRLTAAGPIGYRTAGSQPAPQMGLSGQMSNPLMIGLIGLIFEGLRQGRDSAARTAVVQGDVLIQWPSNSAH